MGPEPKENEILIQLGRFFGQDVKSICIQESTKYKFHFRAIVGTV